MDKNLYHTWVADILAALTTYGWLKAYDPVPLPIVTVVLMTIPSTLAYVLFVATYSSVEFGLAWVYLIFYFTLVVSVSAYRVSPYHPLAKYPGPTVLKLTKLWSAWISYTGKTHTYLKALHDQYGATVRIGPNELSTVDTGLIPDILGNQGMPKGPMWDGRRFGQTGDSKGYDSIADVRDSVLHTQLRKPWNQAFAPAPMKDYEDLLIRRVIQLNKQLEKICSASEGGIGRVDIAKWITYFT